MDPRVIEEATRMLSGALDYQRFICDEYIKSLRSRRDRLGDRKAYYKNLHHQVEREKNELMKQKQQVQSENNTLRNQINEVTRENARVVSQKEAEINLLKEQVEKLSKENESLNRDYRNSRESNQYLMEEMQKDRAEVVKVRTMMSQMNNDVVEIKNKLMEKEDEEEEEEEEEEADEGQETE